MDDLPNNQKRILVSMYKQMLSSQPSLHNEANDFGSADQVNEECNLGLSHDEISDICLALHSKGYIYGDLGDDTIFDISLTDETIVYMENRFKRGLKAVLSFLAELA